MPANFATASTGSGEIADHPGAGGLVVGAAVADPAGLGRAARGVGARVEVEDDGLAAQVRERDLVAVLVGEGEVGGRVAWLEHAPEI